MGNNIGSNCCQTTTRPTYVYNDMLTWVKGRHTIKGGFEYRNITGNAPQLRESKPAPSRSTLRRPVCPRLPAAETRRPASFSGR